MQSQVQEPHLRRSHIDAGSMYRVGPAVTGVGAILMQAGCMGWDLQSQVQEPD